MTQPIALLCPVLQNRIRHVISLNLIWATKRNFINSFQLRSSNGTTGHGRPRQLNGLTKRGDAPLRQSAVSSEQEFIKELLKPEEPEEPEEDEEGTEQDTENRRLNRKERKLYLLEKQAQKKMESKTKMARRRKETRVLVLWDLDNQKPAPRYKDTVKSLRNLASQYGTLTAIEAFANRHAFIDAPPPPRSKTQKKRKAAKLTSTLAPNIKLDAKDQLLRQVVLGTNEPNILTMPTIELRCHICGQKQKTELHLAKHVQTLHLRERRKKLRHIARLNPGLKRERLWKRHETYLERFAVNAARMHDPESHGLKEDLTDFGVKVHVVVDAKEAADGALRKQFRKAEHNRVKCVILISDDTGFRDAIVAAKKKGIGTVVVGSKESGLASSGRSFVPWQKVLDGAFLNQPELDWAPQELDLSNDDKEVNGDGEASSP